MQMIIDIVIDLLICFCGFGLGYKKGWKDKENENA